MRKTVFAEGEYYHLYNRGVDKRVIFSNKKEYERFLAYLYMLNTSADMRPADFFLHHSVDEVYEIERPKPLVAIGAYCLMPNHFHLYVTPLVEGGISKFMQRLQTAYTMYFNERHARSGSLLQGTFKSEHAKKDNHAKYLFSYIHLNPAKLKDSKWKERGARDLGALESFITTYPYSSMKEYTQKDFKILTPEAFPNYFKSKADFDAHLSDWLNARTSREAKPHG